MSGDEPMSLDNIKDVAGSSGSMDQKAIDINEEQGFLENLPLKSGDKDLSVLQGRPGILIPEYLRAELQLDLEMK